MSDVFISYAHEDEELVDRLRAALAAAGREVWVDTADIEPTDRWRLSAHEGIERSDAFLFVVSAHSLRSQPCLGELEHAVSLNKRLIPVSVDREAVDMAKPAALAELSWIKLRPDDDFDAAVRAIVRALDVDLEVVRTHTRILVRARAWELGGRRASPLLRGEELRLAEQWLTRAAASGSPPTELQQEFVAASRRAATRRLGIVAGVSAAVAVVAVGLSIYALVQRSNAIRAETLATSRQLAAVSENTLATNLQVALLLAAKGFRTDANPQTRSALLIADLYSPRLARYLPLRSTVTSLAGSGDRTTVAAGLADGGVMRWQLTRPAPTRLATLRAAVGSVAVDRDGAVVAAVDGSEGIVWRRDGGVSRIACPAGQQPDAAAISPSGRTVVVHCRRNTFEGPQSIVVVAGSGGRAAVHPLRPGGIEPTILVVPSDSELLMLDGTYGRWERRQLPGWGLELASSAEFGVHQYLPGYASGGGWFAVSNGGESIPVWPTDRPTAAFDPPREAQAPISSPTALALSPDGDRIAVADAGTIYVAPVQAAHASYVPPGALVGNGSVNADALRFFGDGQHLLSASGNAIAIWDLTQFDRLARSEPTSLQAPCNGCGGALAAVSPDGSRVAAVADAGDYALVQGLRDGATPEIVGPNAFGPPLWRDQQVLLPSAGPPPQRLPAGVRAWQAVAAGDEIVSAALSADGRSATIVDRRGEVIVEDPETGTTGLHLPGPRDLAGGATQLYTGQAAIDPDARLVAIVDGGAVRVTDLRSRRVTRIPGTDAAYVAFAGGRLLVQRQDGALEVWNARGSARRRSTAGDRSYGGFVPVPDPAGDLVARQRSDGSTTIVDLASGATLGTIPAPAPPSLGLRLGLAFSPDGATLVTIVQAVGSSQSLILRHRIGDRDLLDAGCEAGGRDLTRSEWRTFVGSDPPGDLSCR